MQFNRALPWVAAACVAAGTASLQAAETSKFDQLDQNHDGLVSRDEVRHLKDFTRAFDDADVNKDGKLDRSEFVNAEAIHDRIVAGKYVHDSVVTARVKAALVKEPELKSLDVSVETLAGEVLLSGFVRNEAQRQKAMKAAVAVNGVA